MRCVKFHSQLHVYIFGYYPITIFWWITCSPSTLVPCVLCLVEHMVIVPGFTSTFGGIMQQLSHLLAIYHDLFGSLTPIFSSTFSYHAQIAEPLFSINI